MNSFVDCVWLPERIATLFGKIMFFLKLQSIDLLLIALMVGGCICEPALIIMYIIKWQTGSEVVNAVFKVSSGGRRRQSSNRSASTLARASLVFCSSDPGQVEDILEKPGLSVCAVVSISF